ncbi:MAG TPA: hypothetical protein VK866_00225 [Acidimicrobiales bacterium]|nr:hypothetical protein [Acidimicrobiales bacterium]
MADTRSRSRAPWIIATIVALIALGIAVFFLLGGEADVDVDPGDVNVEETPDVDVDIDPSGIDDDE